MSGEYLKPPTIHATPADSEVYHPKAGFADSFSSQSSRPADSLSDCRSMITGPSRESQSGPSSPHHNGHDAVGGDKKSAGWLNATDSRKNTHMAANKRLSAPTAVSTRTVGERASKGHSGG